jgi:putative addiction module CopG family antidote
MTVNLRPEQEHRVAEAVRSGAYRSSEEVVEQALDLLLERDQWLAAHREEIRRRIDEGYEAAKRGDLIDGDEVRTRFERRKEAWLAERRRA